MMLHKVPRSGLDLREEVDVRGTLGERGRPIWSSLPSDCEATSGDRVLGSLFEPE